jgi:hypothetical protein
LGLSLAGAALTGFACGGTDVLPGDSDETCGGIVGQSCPLGKYCDYEAGSCGKGDVLGKCVAIPSACTQECAKVCGCDGMSYCNACMAHLAGVDDSAETCEGAPLTSN